MRLMQLIIIVLNVVLNVSGRKNVLVVQCVATQSYSQILRSIAFTLAEEFNVTFIDRYSLNTPHSNITLVQMGPHYTNIGQIYKDMYEIVINQDDTSELCINVVLFDTKGYVDELMTDPSTKYIFEHKDLFDVLIMPTSLCAPYARFAHFLNVPLVQVATSYPLPWQNEAIGNPNYLSTDPSLLLEPKSEGFFGRLTKFIQGLKVIYRHNNEYLPNLDKHMEQYFPPNTPKLEQILSNTSLLLVNTQQQMGIAKPRMANYVETGGLHCKPPKDLPPNLKQFAQNAKAGLIYMSLGLTVNSTFPQHILRGILNVFRKLPQKVIFKIAEEVEDLPSNVLTLKGTPQQDILGHPNTKLFITQGGIMSLQEAVYHQVPVFVLPLTLDQPSSAVLARKLGYGRYLRFSQFTEEAFYAEISEILSNSMYMNRVKEISALSKDVSNDSKEHLKWWINYVIRHREGPPTSGQRSSTYHIDVDLLIFFFSVFVIFWFLFVYFVVCVMNNINKYRKIKTE